MTNFDVAAALVDMTEVEEKVDFPSPSYPFKPNETISSNTVSAVEGKTEISFNGVKDDTHITCGVRRAMIVTISNFNKAPQVL
jgi:hypothetical protein